MLRSHFHLRHLVSLQSCMRNIDMARLRAQVNCSGNLLVRCIPVSSPPPRRALVQSSPGALYSGGNCDCNGVQSRISRKHSSSQAMPTNAPFSPGLLTILLVMPIWVADPQSPSLKGHVSWGPLSILARLKLFVPPAIRTAGRRHNYTSIHNVDIGPATLSNPTSLLQPSTNRVHDSFTSRAPQPSPVTS